MKNQIACLGRVVRDEDNLSQCLPICNIYSFGLFFSASVATVTEVDNAHCYFIITGILMYER